MTPLYIFDLDGTLALNEHRQHILADKSNSNRWDDFYRACVWDELNGPVVKIYNSLTYRSNRDNLFSVDRYIFTGRSILIRMDTEKWLQKHHLFTLRLFMRSHGDNTPDEILKKKWYDELSDEDKERLVCVFDDRQKVVDMWRSIGVTCLQVARGDF